MLTPTNAGRKLVRRWHGWQSDVGLLNGVIVAAVLSAGVFWVFDRYGLRFDVAVIDRLLAAKLTFLSLTLAAGFVQYSYLYQIRMTEGERIRTGDAPFWVKQARTRLAEVERSGRTDETFAEWKATMGRWIEAETRRYVDEMKAFNVPLFRNALSILFGLGFALWASLICDVAWLVARPADLVPLRTLSAATMVGAVVLFTVMFLRYVIVLRRELADFFDY